MKFSPESYREISIRRIVTILAFAISLIAMLVAISMSPADSLANIGVQVNRVGQVSSTLRIDETQKLSKKAEVGFSSRGFSPEIRTIAISVSKQKLNRGESTNVSAFVLDQFGNPMVGELVIFFGSLGTLTVDNAVTDSQGKVSTQYTAGKELGKAVIQALVGSANSSMTLQIADSSPTATTNTNDLYLPLINN